MDVTTEASEHRSRHEAINVALLDLSLLGDVSRQFNIPIDKGLLHQLEGNFRHLEMLHYSLRYGLEDYSINSSRLVQLAEEENERREQEKERLKEEKITKNKEKLTQIKKRSEDAVKAIINLDLKMKSLHEQIRSMCLERSRIREMTQSKMKTLRILKGEIFKKEQEERKSTIRLNQMTDQKSKSLEKIKELKEKSEEERQHYTSNVQAHSQSVNELDAQLEKQLGKNGIMQKSLDVIVQEDSVLQSLVSALQDDVHSLTSYEGHLMSQEQELKNSRVLYEDLQADLEKHIHNLNERIKNLDDLESENDMLHEKKLKEIELEMSNLQEEEKRLTLLKPELKKQCHELTEAVEEEKSCQEKVKEAYQESESELAALMVKCQDSKMELQVLSKEVMSKKKLRRKCEQYELFNKR